MADESLAALKIVGGNLLLLAETHDLAENFGEILVLRETVLDLTSNFSGKFKCAWMRQEPFAAAFRQWTPSSNRVCHPYTSH